MEKMNFHQEGLINENKYNQAIEQLKSIGNYWIGDDIYLENGIIVEPKSLKEDVKIKVNLNNFPKIDINKHSLGCLNWSTRSCLAQSGLEVKFNTFYLTDKMIKDINEGKNVLIPIDVINYSKRKIELDGSLMRFFWVNEANRLRNEELREAIKNNEIIIDGTEEKDWSIKKGSNNDEIGIRLLLNEKYYISPSSQVTKVRNKKDLSNVLTEINGNTNDDFVIGETTRIKLGENIVGVINTGMYEGGENHIHSPLIDSLFEGNIRTETFNGLKFIDLFTYKK